MIPFLHIDILMKCVPAVENHTHLTNHFRKKTKRPLSPSLCKQKTWNGHSFCLQLDSTFLLIFEFLFKKMFSWTISFWRRIKNQIWKNIKEYLFAHIIKVKHEIRNFEMEGFDLALCTCVESIKFQPTRLDLVQTPIFGICFWGHIFC